MVVNRLLKDGAKVSIAKPATPGAAATVQVNARPEAWTRAVDGFDVERENHRGAASRPGDRHEGSARGPVSILHRQHGRRLDALDSGALRIRLHHAPQQGYSGRASCATASTRSSCPISAPATSSKATISRSTVPEYKGGLEDRGIDALKDFVDHGGTLIALGEASNLLVDRCRCP